MKYRYIFPLNSARVNEEKLNANYLGLPIECSSNKNDEQLLKDVLLDDIRLDDIGSNIYNDIISIDPSIEKIVNEVLNTKCFNFTQKRKRLLKPNRRITRSYTMRVLRSRSYRLPLYC